MTSTNGSNQLWANGNQTYPLQPTKFINSTPGYQPATLDYYEVVPVTMTASGAVSGTFVIYIARIGKLVTMNVPLFQATAGSTNFINTNAIPTRFINTRDVQKFYILGVNGSAVASLLTVFQDGTLQVGTGTGAPFTSGSLAGFSATSVSWVLS